MKILVITDDKYLYRKAELELCGHTVLCEGSTDSVDLVIYDVDSGLPCPYQNAVTLSRAQGADFTLPIPLGGFLSIVSSPQSLGARLTVSREDNVATLDGVRIKLTSHETALLSLLISSAGSYTSRERIAEEVFKGATDGMINIYIHYLREKLEKGGEKIIISSRGLGYKINDKFLKERKRADVN